MAETWELAPGARVRLKKTPKGEIAGLTNEHVVPDLHGVVLHDASADPARRPEHCSCAHDDHLSDHEAGPRVGGLGQAWLRGRRVVEFVQIAAEMNVGLDDGTAGEGDIGRTRYAGLSGDFV